MDYFTHYSSDCSGLVSWNFAFLRIQFAAFLCNGVLGIIGSLELNVLLNLDSGRHNIINFYLLEGSVLV